MAFTFTDLNKFNIESLSEVITLTVGTMGEMERGATLMVGIQNGDPVVSFTAKDKALRKSKGCGDDYYYDNMSDSVKYYSIIPVVLPLSICLEEIWGKMVARRVHLSDDFNETDLAGFMAIELRKVVEADLIRLAWLGGLATTDTAGEYNFFTNGGFIKQYQASSQTEVAMTLTEEGVVTAMKKLIDNQRPDKREFSEFYVTSNVLRLYINHLESLGNTTSQMILEDGRKYYTIEGYKINELPHVSASLSADESIMPITAFAAYTTKDNIRIALETDEIGIKPFRQDPKDNKYYSRTIFGADLMLAVPEIMQLATTAKAGA
ncbi:hypothetical protein SAMN05444349_11883 [Bacteroides faecichinchillae]|uniref:Phage major capsid protein E n=1 Tax=Bacteroides faecichinchillae TaxID=871325 RepID=A0A1M5BE40_9BACE|nr:hypothetical protein [Bacteroides faecichinchillae]SHF40716.1 hypothetical protein SAMN05444349_11883 [Bacteroides faecichinchillae]